VTGSASREFSREGSTHDCHASFVGTPAVAAQASCSCGWKGPLHNNFEIRPIDRWWAATLDRDEHKRLVGLKS